MDFVGPMGDWKLPIKVTVKRFWKEVLTGSSAPGQYKLFRAGPTNPWGQAKARFSTAGIGLHFPLSDNSGDTIGLSTETIQGSLKMALDNKIASVLHLTSKVRRYRNHICNLQMKMSTEGLLPKRPHASTALL